MKIPAKVRDLALKHKINVRRDHHGDYTIWDARYKVFAQSAGGALAKIRQLVRTDPAWRGPSQKNPAPAGFISGPHMHDPRDPGVYYPPSAIKKAIHSRANPKFTRYLTKTGRLTKSKKHHSKVMLAKMRKLSKKRNPAQHWYVHIQRANGPVMLYNGVGFADPRNKKPLPFTSADSAMYKARWLLGKYHRQLSKYKIWVSDMFHGAPTVNTRVNSRRRNPEKLDEAARKLEDFTGYKATHVERAPARSNDKTGLVVGELQAVEYVAAREGIEGGKKVLWHHKFRKGSRPLLAATTDGKQLHVVGGQYEFTDAGIEDR